MGDRKSLSAPRSTQDGGLWDCKPNFRSLLLFFDGCMGQNSPHILGAVAVLCIWWLCFHTASWVMVLRTQKYVLAWGGKNRVLSGFFNLDTFHISSLAGLCGGLSGICYALYFVPARREDVCTVHSEGTFTFLNYFCCFLLFLFGFGFVF